MSTITINYDRLLDASKYTKNISSNMGTYSDAITGKVIRKLNSLSGSDERGYISSALSHAGRKVQELAEKSEKVRKFGSDLETLVSDARRADSNVAGNIKSTGGSYVGKRTVFQQIGDWFYNTFCVDLPNSNGITRLIANCVKWGAGKVSGAVESVKNWFKYKGGKYLGNIVLTVVGVGLAIASAVVAVLTCGTVLAIIAAVASVVVAVIAIINGAIAVTQNWKAMDKHSRGELGQARYYGSIEGFSDAMEKYDMGDAAANKKFKLAGDTIGWIETICGVIIGVNGIANYAGVKDVKTGKITKYKFEKDNIKKNIMESLGFRKERKRYSMDSKGKLIDYNGEKSGYKYADKWKMDDIFKKRSDGQNKSFLKNYFGFGKTDSIFYGSQNGFSPKDGLTLKEKFNKLSSTQKVTKTFYDTLNVANTTKGRIEGINTLYNNIKNGINSEGGIGETLKNWRDAANNLLSVFDFVKPVDFVKTVISPGDKLVWSVYDTVSEKKEVQAQADGG